MLFNHDAVVILKNVNDLGSYITEVVTKDGLSRWYPWIATSELQTAWKELGVYDDPSIEGEGMDEVWESIHGPLEYLDDGCDYIEDFI